MSIIHKVSLLGVGLNLGSKQQTIQRLLNQLTSADRGLQIVTPNPEHLIQAQENPDFLKILNNADLSIIDGVGITFALNILKLLRIKKLNDPFERIAGVDFISDLLQISKNKTWNIGLLGGAQLARSISVRNLQNQHPGVNIVNIGEHHNIRDYSSKENQDLIKQINTQKVNLLLVAYGAPYQEIWISEYLPQLNSVKLAMGVGGSFDFISSKIPRAPKLLRKMGLEWLFRLFQQPRRFKRQLRLLRFVMLVITKEIFTR